MERIYRGRGRPLGGGSGRSAVAKTATIVVVLVQLAWSAAAHAQAAGASTARLYLDPATGAVTAGAPPHADALELSERESQMLGASSQGLFARRTGNAGGLTVHLQGRFRQLSVATVDATGRVEHRCIGPVDVDHDDHSSSADAAHELVPALRPDPAVVR